MWPTTPRLYPIGVPSIHDSDMLEFTLDSSASGESDATSRDEGEAKAFQSSENEDHIAQRNTDAKFTEERKTFVEVEHAIAAKSQKHGKCDSHSFRRRTSSDKCSSSENDSLCADTDFGTQYFRVDELWDDRIHAFKLTETIAATAGDEHDEYVFQVRRRFDCDGKYKETVVDIKSKVLRNILRTVMSSCKGVSLGDEAPTINPDMFFLYLEDIKKHYDMINGKSSSTEKHNHKAAADGAMHLKCLIDYVEQDYKSVKKALYPMIKAGNITFDLLWTLFRSDMIVYTSTYSALDEPRAFKVDHVTKDSSRKGTWYEVEGQYLDFDGKAFGLANITVKIDSFKGLKLLDSLPCYPIKYHRKHESVQKQLIERGKKFVTLAGMNYKSHIGLGFPKLDIEVMKISINSRVMVDPRTFRRVNPNYPVSDVQSAGLDLPLKPHRASGDEERCRYGNLSSKFRPLLDDRNENESLEVEVDSGCNRTENESMDKPHGQRGEVKREFTKEELLISSPVVLGFVFSKKLWLELTVSGIQEIEWSKGAFDSLVIPDDQKSIIKALVQSQVSEAQGRKTIDDVIKGKGKGLVAVLHGSPGVGKTLTAEGIAELFQCPLFHISAGELGTDPRELERELTMALELAYNWGAVLLLDEADVFLEARTGQDIHRNALVTVFLRLLEYFQGILFLTTNRITCFDTAFQSRIHMAIKYHELDFRARRAVFKIFLDRVAAITPSAFVVPSIVTSKGQQVFATAFSDTELDRLARRGTLNGRQIKNTVRCAQALAVSERKPLAMHHLLKVIEAAEVFEQDLNGGTGYLDAMRSYT